ncbi:hypothetical protein [Streptomyces sp. ISL-94]|uniref:hypothetical protein n=1 Tax=Streptomyces sp. ISL-94 TaxID=2819190 RepID=UPI001BEB6168|nr:hypothetical protein [Streptomyces sp. ISL-94]MBT2481092.1 hypothetical protein [Streptomyces sp. ISL-94]
MRAVAGCVTMAGYWLTVCLPGEARERLEEAVGGALAPFWLDSDGEISVDLRIWDHWRIRGGSEGAGYRIRPGHEEDHRIIHDHPRWDGSVEPSLPGWCAGGPRGLLEVTGPWERAAALARLVWDGWQEVARAHPPARPWEDFLPERRPGMAYSDYSALLAAAHEEYLAQTPAAAFRDWAAGLRVDSGAEELRPRIVDSVTHDPLGMIGGCTREEFARRAARWAVGYGNVLTLDGWWCEEGHPPLHGACDDPATCSHTSSAAGDGGGSAYLAGLSADTLLVSVRCHV